MQQLCVVLIHLGWFSLVWFYGISTIVGYLMPNHVYSGILDTYMICKHILLIKFLNEPEIFFCLQLNGFMFCYITVVIIVVIYRAFLLRCGSRLYMNGAPNETQIHLSSFASLAC